MTSQAPIRTRSWLFTATRPERFAKASEAGADVAILDLEDAVAPEDKVARQDHCSRNSVAATAGLTALDQRLALLRQGDPRTSLVQRERGRVLAVCDAFVRHRSYFDAGALV